MKFKTTLYPLVAIACFFGCSNQDIESTSDWEEIETIAEVWAAYPNRLRSLFAALNLQQASLVPVENLLATGDTVKAAEALLQHFSQVDRTWVVEALDPLPEKEATSIANILLADSIILHSYQDKIPRLPHGGWQWNYTGPENDAEFAYSLNTHNYLPALSIVWQKTKDPQLVKVFDQIIKDWVIQHDLPPASDSIYLVLNNQEGLDYRDIEEVEWRTLDTGRRLGASWPQTFYAFQPASTFSPATRLLMLSSICEQAAYIKHYHKRGHNWTTMEMNGLALVGLAFPEFKVAEEWANYALEVMSNEINRQVYPDGVQTEISTKTQWVALRRFESLANNFQKANRPLTDAYFQRVEDMYHYLAYSIRPDGHQPLNNDSDREDLRPRVLVAAEKFDRSDWKWIATNGGSGEKPRTEPTITFPWAGIHVMRNGWDKNAHWAFFDTGPYGTGHQHRDKLHLSVTAFGKDLLVDGGRYTHRDYFSFDPTVWRGYFRSSFSHNVLLVDGNGQNAGALRAEVPLVDQQDYFHHPLYDYAQGTFSEGYQDVEGQAVHSRSVLYLKDQYWLVVDHFETDRTREVQALWHYAPSCQVNLDGQAAVSTNSEEANLRIVPLTDIDWQVDIISGQETPVIQGWYSGDYGKKVPNATVVYSATIAQSTTFAWLLVPALGAVPAIDARFQKSGDLVSIVVNKADEAAVEISLPLDKDLSKIKIIK